MTPGSAAETLLHASCVAVDGRAVLIVGPSGSGKSDLALRLIDRGATLVADDCTLVREERGVLLASAADSIAGLLEVRGIGILPFSHRDGVPIALVAATDGVPVALVAVTDGAIERLPEAHVTRDIAGVAVPLIAVAALEASAPIKIELALRQHGAGREG